MLSDLHDKTRFHLVNRYGAIPEPEDNKLYYFGEVAGMKDCIVQYVFDEKHQLQIMRYKFAMNYADHELYYIYGMDDYKALDRSNSKLLNMLIEKYGKPLCEEDTISRIIEIEPETNEKAMLQWLYDKLGNPYKADERDHIAYDYVGKAGKIIYDDYYMWLQKIDKGYILITYASAYFKLEYLYNYKDKNDFGDESSEFVTYRHLRPGELEEFFISGLNEIKKKKEEAAKKAQKDREEKQKQYEEI